MRGYSALIVIVLAACHHSGSGEGVLASSPAKFKDEHGIAAEVKFSWSSGADVSSGKMQAVLADGTVFNGSFLQVRSTVSSDVAGPYFDAWSSPTWGVGSPWYAGARDEFVTIYGGETLAHLKDQKGDRMRCRFVLRDPVAGFVGGAEGQCQLSTGETIFDAELDRRKG